MFAWLHQSIPFEKENLHLLLKDCEKNDLSEQSQAALAHIADGVCHALKVLVETILNGCNDLIILYSISNLIRFYQTILKQVRMNPSKSYFSSNREVGMQFIEICLP